MKSAAAVYRFQDDFPFLKNNPGYIYFDSAATTLKPKSVIDCYAEYYSTICSNIHRSTHRIAEEATLAFEGVRDQLSSFFRCDQNEILFTANCSDGINLVTQWLRLNRNDQVIVSEFEHHSNYLPWKACASLVTAPINASGEIDLDMLEASITNRTRLIAVSYVSNVTGNIQPVREVVEIARRHGILTLIDAAQAVAHLTIDLQALQCDFLVLSAHKMLGPSGVGVLFARQSFLQDCKPARFGGGMVQDASVGTWKQGPHGHEVGTPNIESVIAFGKAIFYYERHGYATIEKHLQTLERAFSARLQDFPCLESPFPISSHHVPIFTLRPRNRMMDLQQLGRILSDTHDIAVSVGMQCCQPFYHSHSLDGGLRASLYIYNTVEDVEQFFDAISALKGFLSHA